MRIDGIITSSYFSDLVPEAEYLVFERNVLDVDQPFKIEIYRDQSGDYAAHITGYLLSPEKNGRRLEDMDEQELSLIHGSFEVSPILTKDNPEANREHFYVLGKAVARAKLLHPSQVINSDDGKVLLTF